MQYSGCTRITCEIQVDPTQRSIKSTLFSRFLVEYYVQVVQEPVFREVGVGARVDELVAVHGVIRPVPSIGMHTFHLNVHAHVPRMGIEGLKLILM